MLLFAMHRAINIHSTSMSCIVLCINKIITWLFQLDLRRRKNASRQYYEARVSSGRTSTWLFSRPCGAAACAGVRARARCPGRCARVRERQKSVDRRYFVAAGRAIEARGNNLRLRFCSAIRIALARCRASAHDLVGLGILSIIWQSTAVAQRPSRHH